MYFSGCSLSCTSLSMVFESLALLTTLARSCPQRLSLGSCTGLWVFMLVSSCMCQMVVVHLVNGAPSECEVPVIFLFLAGCTFRLIQLISRKISLKFCALFKLMMETGQH